jgi:polysaccharide export outer membrane protein
MACILIALLIAATAYPQPRQALTPEITASNLPANLPVQKIGPNDLIAVSVYDAPEFSRTIRVSADGQIRFPMLKQRISAAGRLPSELEVEIANVLRQADLIVNPFVTVTMVEYYSRPISLAGAVRKPLTFQATGPTTLLEALSKAEGLTPTAGTEILVTRPVAGEEKVFVQRIPVKGLIDAADPELNIPLNGGEEIRVPEAGKVFVVGNVRKPGAFPMLDDGDTTVLKVLALSEGLLPFASKQAYLYRREASGTKNEITIELKQIMDRKAADVPLQAEDVLYVPDNSRRRATMSAIERLILFGSTAGATALIFR